MITIHKSGKITIPQEDGFIGYAGDNLNKTLEFTVENQTDESLNYRIFLQFDDDTVNYFLLSRKIVGNNTILIWNVTQDHLYKDGIVYMQIKAFSTNGEVFHTESVPIFVGKSIEFCDYLAERPVSEYIEHEKQLNQLIVDVENAKEFLPYIGNNGNWYVYDYDVKAYYDTGVTALGSSEKYPLSTEITSESTDANGSSAKSVYTYGQQILSDSKEYFSTNAGELEYLNTEDKSSIVNALNEIESKKLNNTTSSVTNSNLADKAVTTEKIAENSITTDKIKQGSVTSSKLASDAINENTLSSDLRSKINSKLNSPASYGTAGQVLMTSGGENGAVFWSTVNGGSGTNDYKQLQNKPSINDVSLVGNVTLEQLGVKDGVDGVGIESIEQNGVSSEDNGMNYITITLTDGTQSTFVVLNGSKGSQGTSVRTKFITESLDDGGENVVDFSDGNKLRIKNGSKGSKGDKGDKGDTGSKGDTGAAGKDGKDGYTPIKGTDYWTEADKSEIIGEINSSIVSIPDYVIAEAERVAANVQSVRTGQSFTFAGFSDAHIGYNATSKTSVTHAGMGLKCIREIANVDLVAHFGDYINGSSTSTKAGSIEEYKTYHKAMYDGCNGADNVWLQGNHDANYQGGDTFTLDEMYSYIGSNNAGNHTVNYGYENKLYGFIDYPTKRLRVIYLNSSDGWKTGITDEQSDWLSNTAFDLSDKSDVSNWGIVIFIHIPVTFADNAKILTAINNYSGKAEIIGIFHGHCHNFRTERVTNKQIWQIGIPELCVGRNNEYATATDDYKGIFGELDSDGNPVYYPKTSNTAQDTSFNIVTIDRVSKKIYCHCFGAGYDRTIDYSNSGDVSVNYSVTNDLTNVSTNNTATTIKSGNAYTANLTANEGYVLDSVTVTMGGIDITSTAYNSGVINIPSVTSNIVITAKAVSSSSGDETTYTNLFDPTADGFADTTRFSSSGETEGSCYLSNYITFNYGDVIRVRCPNGTYKDGVGANQRVIRFYNTSKTLISDYYINTTADGCLVADTDGHGFTFTCNASNLADGGYFRVCGNPNRNYADFVITKNEVI